ncbi:MAG: type IV-A pilus assembly ATPase PilB [Bdellovibrionaceae bacterium]|nr:type IV-A pilus assembly ATPase PilB [Pseudobdellovibrionaceae bacterium]MDW8189402.1 type IV-A pilus assembly ATPase PilB [Pseudobdellovibrionaceae bacterium]
MAKIGELLVKEGYLKSDQLQKAQEYSKRTGQNLISAIINLGFLTDEQILKAKEKIFKIPGVDLNKFPVQKSAVELIPRDFCEKNILIPIQTVGDQAILIAFAEPGNLQILDQIRFITKRKIQSVVGTEPSILAAIDRYHMASASVAQGALAEVEAFSEGDVAVGGDAVVNLAGVDSSGGEDAPIVKFVHTILLEAIRLKASDIHFEPYEKRLRVRFRLDGNLVEVQNQPVGIASAVASRLKIMSKLDIAEKRRPQDGRIKIQFKTTKGIQDMDFRVSVMPTIHGEKIVLRLLDKTNLQLDMTKLGFEPDDLELFRKHIHMPQGMILITGPTGSGKTTTIYSALADLNKPDVNISTAEDPVEFNLEGINQLQVNPDIGVTFSEALKTFLRQDPDIIMVGEIRDLETAEIAAKAASTGHLVVSTLHTNDAPQTVTRLIEMGVAPYVITSTINLIVAQRLIGKICDTCKVLQKVPDQVLLDLGADYAELGEYKIFSAKGCNVCHGSGIKGRIAIFELLVMSDSIKEAVLKGASANELRIIAKKEGMRTLRRSALLKLKRGQTTIQEVINSSVRDV